jgi:signal transduction histidine kinase
MRFVIDYGQDVSPVALDRHRFSRVVDALLANAHSLTPSGAIDVCVKQMGDRVIAEVGGCNMDVPGEELSHVFDRFYHGDPTDSGGLQGVGPGLFVAKAIIEAHRGTIGFQGFADGGGAFIVSLPTD